MRFIYLNKVVESLRLMATIIVDTYLEIVSSVGMPTIFKSVPNRIEPKRY